SGVEATPALVAGLLAARLEPAPHVVQYFDHHFVRARFDQFCDVEPESRALADVAAGELAVDEHPSPVVDPAEMQAQAFVLHGGRQLEGAAIPDVLQSLRVT